MVRSIKNVYFVLIAREINCNKQTNFGTRKDLLKLKEMLVNQKLQLKST